MDDHETNDAQLNMAREIVRNSWFTCKIIEIISIPLVMCMCFTSYLSATESPIHHVGTIFLACLFGVGMHMRDLCVVVHDHYLNIILDNTES